MSAPGILATCTYDTGTGRTVGQTATTAGAKTTYIVDADDRLASMSDSAGKTTYVFDALGRRSSQTLSGTTTTFGWDDASRLTSWTRGADSAVYTYDAAGQRTRTVHTQGGKTPVVTTTDYTYDGITLLALSAAQGTATWTVTYLYDEDTRPYAGVYTAAGVSTPVTFLIATNDRGDVVALTNTEGAWFSRYTYDPYGRVLSQTTQAAGAVTSTLASQIATRQVLRYASYVYDAHSATYYLAARHYDPATARFLTKDPARDDGEESAYQYCGGDPVGKVDPTGEAAKYLNVPTFLYKEACWAPVVKSIIRYVKGALIYEGHLVKTAFGGRDPGKGNRGATPKRIGETLKAYGLRCTVRSRALTFGEVKREIDAGRPIYVHWVSGSSAHAVLVRGYEDSKTKYVHYMDPSAHGRRRLCWDRFNTTGGSGGWPSYSWRWTATVSDIRR